MLMSNGITENTTTPAGNTAAPPTWPPKLCLPLDPRKVPSCCLWHVIQAEFHVPQIIAAVLPAAFSKSLADAIANGPDNVRLRNGLDGFIQQLIWDFCIQLRDELRAFFSTVADILPCQPMACLYSGPVHQILHVIGGPETPHYFLKRIGLGLSAARNGLSAASNGLSATLELLCDFWQSLFPGILPTGSSSRHTARTLNALILKSQSWRILVDHMRWLLFSSNCTHIHLADLVRPRVALPWPPASGYRLMRFTVHCDLFTPQAGIVDPMCGPLGSLPAITGTAASCVHTTVAEYSNRSWPNCGSVVLGCLEEASAKLASSYSHQASGGSSGSSCSGYSESRYPAHLLTFVSLEVDEWSVRVCVFATTQAMADIFQQMCWTCAALSSSPCSNSVSECTVEVSNWAYRDAYIYVDCNMSHEPVPRDETMPWMKDFRGAAIAYGFPLAGFLPLSSTAA